MVDVGELVRFTPGERTLRLVMDIAAALERYRIVMEGPAGVRLRKLNHVRTIRGTTAIEGNTLTEDQVTDIIAGKRPRTLKARGESQGGKKKVVRKGGKKTADRLLELICGNPKITFAEMSSAAGISRFFFTRYTLFILKSFPKRQPEKGLQPRTKQYHRAKKAP